MLRVTGCHVPAHRYTYMYVFIMPVLVMLLKCHWQDLFELSSLPKFVMVRVLVYTRATYASVLPAGTIDGSKNVYKRCGQVHGMI